MDVAFTGEIWHWRGPSPYYFVTVPEEQSDDLHELAGVVTYGWGMIPVQVRVGDTRWETSLFPKNGRYVVPLKVAVRRSEGLDVGDTIAVQLTVPGAT